MNETTEHPYGWQKGQPFPPEEICRPSKNVAGLWVGICVFCGGSLGRPYQEDLFHKECYSEEEQN